MCSTGILNLIFHAILKNWSGTGQLCFQPLVCLNESHMWDKERTPGFVPAPTSDAIFENPPRLLQGASGALR